MAEQGKQLGVKEHAVFGAVMSVPVLMITVGIGFASGDWLLPALTVPVMMGLFITGGWIIPILSRYRPVVSTAALIGWIIGVAAGITLIVFGINLIATYTPECVPTATTTCRGLKNGTDVGEVSVGEQYFQNTMIALAPILVGGLLLAVMGRPAVTYLKSAARKRREEAG